jgi:hypothetical protein
MNIYDNMHQNMHKEELTGSFVVACNIGDLDAIKSLLENPDFEKHVDVHFNNDVAFQWILCNNRFEVMKYLILEYQIDKTKKIKEYLTTFRKESIIKEAIRLFELQELNSSLNKELTTNDNKNRKIKL